MEYAEVEERWRHGESVSGVAFAQGTHVRIMEGPFADECARVRDLVAVAPEPCYRVEVDAAHVELELAQSALGAT
jgi:transcription antitermination factor NusG